jgi:hypothetical protein
MQFELETWIDHPLLANDNYLELKVFVEDLSFIAKGDIKNRFYAFRGKRENKV